MGNETKSELWHVEHAYTPRETGSYGGHDHYVLNQPIKFGRLKRDKGDALCKPRRKFWGLDAVEDDWPATCERCMIIAARILASPGILNAGREPDGGQDG